MRVPRVFFFSVCVLALAAVGMAAFAIGRSGRTSASEAARVASSSRATAYEVAYRSAAASGRGLGNAQGGSDGRAAGSRGGVRDGHRAGARVLARRRAAAAAARAKAAAAATAAATTSNNSPNAACPGNLVPQGTEACVVRGTSAEGGQFAGCGGDPYATPSRAGGCIQAANPPIPGVNEGPATNCSAGQVPVGQRGACAPSSTVPSSSTAPADDGQPYDPYSNPAANGCIQLGNCP